MRGQEHQRVAPVEFAQRGQAGFVAVHLPGRRVDGTHGLGEQVRDRPALCGDQFVQRSLGPPVYLLRVRPGFVGDQFEPAQELRGVQDLLGDQSRHFVPVADHSAFGAFERDHRGAHHRARERFGRTGVMQRRRLWIVGPQLAEPGRAAGEDQMPVRGTRDQTALREPVGPAGVGEQGQIAEGHPPDAVAFGGQPQYPDRHHQRVVGAAGESVGHGAGIQIELGHRGAHAQFGGQSTVGDPAPDEFAFGARGRIDQGYH